MRKKKRKIIIAIILVLVIVLFVGGFYFLKLSDTKEKELEQQRDLEKAIKSHYSTTVTVNKDANIYMLNNNEYTVIGTIKKDEIIALEDINKQDEYFKIKDLDNTYYINYQDVNPTTETYQEDKRYLNYIPFNENIETKDNVNFYDNEGNLIYHIKKSFSLPILIKYDDSYGVIYNDRLLIIHKEDVKEIKENKNTDLVPTKDIAVLNYHFFYDEKEEKERKDCDQIICLSKSLFTDHLKYIKENKIFTPTMIEYELWHDKKINLPKSVVITIDDGWRMQIGIDLLEEYKLNGTVFLITSWFKNEIKFLHDYQYVEFHSHGDNIHNQGACPGGQGGAIKCLEKSKLLDDLALSRKKLEGSTYFCYPFYEYNNYSIEVLKEAGFTMAFAGGGRSNQNSNKYAIPRYVIYNTTSVGTLKNYIG